MCLYGVRREEDLVERDWLENQCTLRTAVSREDIPGTHHGRITDLLGDVPVNGDIHYYLCGLDSMIDEVCINLESRGVPLNHIHRECFFNA